MGASGQRLYMRLQHPDTCKLSMAIVCKATAYIISGDHVSAGDTCGEWTSVKFQGKKHEVYGWVESYRLTDALMRRHIRRSMSMASFPKTPVWCAGVRDYYDRICWIKSVNPHLKSCRTRGRGAEDWKSGRPAARC